MKLKYVTVKLIVEWNESPKGTPFKLDEETAKNWVEMGRAEYVNKKNK